MGTVLDYGDGYPRTCMKYVLAEGRRLRVDALQDHDNSYIPVRLRAIPRCYTVTSSLDPLAKSNIEMEKLFEDIRGSPSLAGSRLTGRSALLEILYIRTIARRVYE